MSRRLLQDDSEEDPEPTGMPGHRGVAPWLADAARAGSRPAAPAVESAHAAQVGNVEASRGADSGVQEDSVQQAVAASSLTQEEPALVNLQTLDEPQRLSITDMPPPHPASAAEVCCHDR